MPTHSGPTPATTASKPSAPTRSRWRQDPLKTLANTPFALLVTVIGTWAGFGLAFAAIEPDLSWFDGLYWSSVVKSTLGFGDVLPTMWQSKLLTMVYVTWAIYFLLPAAIFHVGERILQSQHSFDHEEQEELLSDAEEARQNTAHLRDEVAALRADMARLLRELQPAPEDHGRDVVP